LSTLSQNNIVVNYVLNDDQVNKAKTAYDKLTDAEKKAVDETRKLNDQLKKTGQEGQDSGKKTETALLRVTGPIRQNSAALSAFTSQLKVAGEVATTAANKASAGFAGVEAKQKAAAAAANAFRNALGSISPAPIIKVKEESQNAAKELNGFSSIAKSGAGLLAGFFAVGSLIAFKDRLVETTIKFEGYSKAIQFGSGSAENFAKNQQFLNDLIQKYGLGLASTTEAYKSFFNASTLAGQSQAETNKQFEAVTKAGTVLKLTTDQMQGAFLAMGQMMSKGTVQAEELRGQLGERIPGAFSIMAKALGVNERQLNKMLEQGQVLSKDALPKFAAELEKTFGGEAEKNLNGMVNTMNRFYNSIDRLYIKLGESILGSVIEREIKIWTGYFNFISDLFTSNAELNEKKWNDRVKAVEEGTKKEIELEKAKYNEINKANATSGAIARGLLNKEAKDYEYYKMRVKFFNLQEDKANLELFEKRRAILFQTIKDQEIANKGKVVSKGLTDAEIKALKDQYNARLRLLELEFQQEKLRNELAGFDAPQTKLRAEESFLKNKFALQKEFGDKGVDLLKEESQTTSLQRQIVSKELESTLKTDTLQIKGYSESVKQFEKDQTENAKKAAIETEKARKSSMDKTVSDNEEMAKNTNAIADEIAKKEEARIKKIQQLKEEANQQAFDLAVDTTNSLFNLQSQYAANDFARKQKQFDEEVRLADGNVQKLTEIEERRRIAEKDYKTKEFRANQTQAVANAVFSAAPYIIKYSAGLPLTSANLALTLGALAAQTGFILAQPVPEFAEGTKGKAFKGKAIVGEKGTELVTTLSGKQYYTPPTATLAQFDEPVHITPNHLLGLNDRYLSSQYFNNSSKKDNSGMQIVTKLEAIENGLKNMPVAAISLDEKGFMKKVRTPNRSTTILNNRYKN